jgi:phosphopantetheinyl transferase
MSKGSKIKYSLTDTNLTEFIKMNINANRYEIICTNVSKDRTGFTDIGIHAKQKVFFGKSEDFKTEIEFFITKLSVDEINRMNRFVSDCDRLTYCVVHGLLRLSFYEILNSKEPVFESFGDTKPRLVDKKIDFSLSHTKNYFAYAISGNEGGTIGIDIERINYLKDYKSIACNFMHADEKEYILDRSLSPNEQIVRFYEIWTRKEAFLKMMGVGVLCDLPMINMIPGSNILNINFDTSYHGENRKITIYTLLNNNIALSISADFGFIPDFIEIQNTQ